MSYDNDTCKELPTCLCCLSKNKKLLSLGFQPLANNFHNINESEDNYPLQLNYCPNCFHCQLSHAINPVILFKNYKYVSGTSSTGLNFFKENAEYIHTYKNIVNGNVLDIACNDGSQLDYFKNLNWNTYGVDPAENLIPITKSKGHNVICDFWNDAAALKLPKMDVIIAQNVFAHTEYIDNFLKSCKLIMHDNTSLFIQTSQKNMIINNEFDTIYHEHISFFNTKSMNILVSRNGLVLNRVLENQIHGISYIFEIKVQKDLKIYNIDDIIHKEELIGIYNHEIYNTFSLNAQQSVINIKSCLEKYKNDGFKCIGFGAAAKGQTFICYGDIQLDYIIDENPLKIGLYSPKLNIPIVDLTYFKNDFSEKIIIVILAWNFSKEIISKIRDLNKNNTIVIIEKYFPELILFLE